MTRRKLPSPPEVVCTELAEARRLGLTFDQAWTYRAWPALFRRVAEQEPGARDDWRAAISATRSEWQAAYEGTETHFSLALASRDSFMDGLADYIAEPESVAA